MNMAKMGRKIPVLGLVVASRITPTQTAKMATVTNMYFMVMTLLGLL